MARRAGGYKKSDPTEWAECSRSTYGEAIVSANRAGLDVYTWMNDAIVCHVYRLKLEEARERYAEAKAEAERTLSPTPLQSDYMPKEPPPTLTRGRGPTQGAGQGPMPRQ